VRLLLVNSAWPESWGGGEKWSVEAAKWFREQRHQSAVCARPDSMLLQSAKRRELETIVFPFGGDFDPFVIARAKTILKRYRPDCVMVNFNKEAWQFGFAARALNIPVVARHGFPLLQNKIHHRYLLKNNITRLIVNAASIRDGYLADGIAAEKAIVIHNGVKPAESSKGELRKRLRMTADEILILSAGRLESQKRFDRVIEIAKLLCPKYSRLRFVILGSGHLSGDLRQQIQAAGLTDQVSIGKFVRNFASLTGDADLFLLTSDNEGTPNVLLEAMAAGVCCFSTPVGAVPQIFDDTFSAQLLTGEISDMANRIEKLIVNEKQRQDIGNRMRQHVREHFSFDKSMKQYEQIIAKLCLAAS
jgi:glycosyltransferase involved in cell wall biosynthesis